MADYLEGDLDLTQRALLDAHLDTCSACSREFAEMTATIGLLRALPSPEPPPFLVGRVMARVREGEGRSGLANRLRGWARALATPQVALPATALAVGLLMANGNVDLSGIGWHSEGQSARPETQRPMRLGTEAGSQRATEVASNPTMFGPTSVWTEGGTRVVQVPHRPPVGPPPVVAHAPHVSIALPSPVGFGQGLGAAPSSPRQLTRWSSRSVLSLGVDPSSSFYSMPVGTQAGSLSSLDSVMNRGSSFSTVSESAVERAVPRLDPRLESLLASPALFSTEFAGLPVGEQEVWLRELAEQAIELDLDEEVLRRLRSSADSRTLALATAFSAEMRRIGDPARTSARAQEGASRRP
jgi:hypothetical protein